MPKTNWTIRKAEDSDAQALDDCMHAAYQTYASRLNGKTLPPMHVDYIEEIRSYPVWVAESNGTVAGGLILMPEDNYMTIANIGVNPDYQGKGLGRGLMEYAEGEALKQGYSELRLATHIALIENLSLYTHLGWSEIDRDESRVYMRKVITKS